MIFDPTAGYIDTPGGIGKFIEYDGKNGVVTVRLNNRLVMFPGSECYIGGQMMEISKQLMLKTIDGLHWAAIAAQKGIITRDVLDDQFEIVKGAVERWPEEKKEAM